MANIDSQINDRMAAYAGNPQALMQRYAQTQELVDLLALQKMKNDRAAAATSIQSAMQTNTNTYKNQLEQEAMQGARNDILRSMAPGIQQQGVRTAQMQNRAAMGIPTQPAPNMRFAASGGLIGYADGGAIMGPPEPNLYQRMGQGLKNYGTNAQESMDMLRAAKAGIGVPYENRSAAIQQVRDQIAAEKQNRDPNFIQRMGQKLMNAGLNVEESKSILKKFYDTFGKTYEEMSKGMAMGGIVGYKKGGGIDIDALLDSLMMAESGGDPRAVSNVGAEGAYQIMPATAADPGFGVPPMEGSRFDPEASRKFAKQYLQAMLDRYDGDVEAALVAYNAGPGNADKFVAAGKDYDVLPMAMQTKPYVERVMGKMPQEDAGTKIDVRPGESYSQARRRTDQERANRALAARYATVPEKQETEMYEPNIGDALAVAEAQTKLRGGPEMNVGERDPRFSDPANYLRDMGAKQEDDNRTRFAQAFPKAEKAVADYAEDKKLGGLGALRTMGRLQESRRNAFSQAFPKAAQAAADYAADKEMGGIGALRVAGRLQAQREANEMAEAQRAVDYLKQQAQMQQMLESIDPAADVQNFNEGGGVAGFLRNLIAPERESLEGVDLSVVSEENPLAEPRMTPSELIEPFKDDPVGATANLILGAYGGAKILGMTGKALQPVVKKYGPAAVQRAKDLAAKAVTTPKMSGPGSAVRGPKGKMMSAEKAREAGVPLNRQFSPGRTAVTGALGVKAADYFMDEEFPVAPTDVTVPTRAEAFRQTPLGNVMEVQNMMEDMYGPTPKQQPAPKKGGLDIDFRALREFLAGGAGQTSTAGALASGAKRLGAFQTAEQKRKDEQKALRDQFALEREKLNANRAVAESKALADLNKEQREAVSKFLTDPTTQARMAELQEQLGVESPYDQRVLAALKPDITAYLNARIGSVGGMGGLNTQPGLSAEQKASLEAFLAS